MSMIFQLSLEEDSTTPLQQSQKVVYMKENRCPIHKLVKQYRRQEKPDFDPSTPKKIILGFSKM